MGVVIKCLFHDLIGPELKDVFDVIIGGIKVYLILLLGV
jgi:hypothetical protein